MKILLATVLFFAMVLSISGQLAYSESQFQAFDAKGTPVSLANIIQSAGNADVIFFGEMHDDAVGHAIQAEAFRRIVAEYGGKRSVVLSLEMFERDVQTVVNEYLASLISEQHFLSSSRPWPRYATDYKPLVEHAKEKKLPVIAANAPRRYVNMVSRGGRAKLDGLSKEANEWLAPLPYGDPSPAYAAKFKALMGPSAEARMGIDNILSSQSLWDATMAYWISRGLKEHKNALVVHLNGGFHTESRLGTVEHLLRYRKKARVIVVTMRYEDDFKTFDKAKHTDLGDFVILTAPKSKISAILERMEIHNRTIKTLNAELTMVQYNKRLDVSDTYKGSANYAPKAGSGRAAHLRVDWNKPRQEQIVLIGDDYEYYQPRLNIVYTGTLGGGTETMAWGGGLSFLKMSKAQLMAIYDVAYIGEEQIAGGVNTWHLLVTSKTATGYKSAEIWLDLDGMPRQVKLNLQNGDTTSVMLSNLQKNAPLSTRTFQLEYPRSVKRQKT